MDEYPSGDDVPGCWFVFAPLVGIALLVLAFIVATGH